MEAKREKMEDAPVQTESSAKNRSGTRATTRAGARGEAIFAYLAEKPDIAGLMQEYPQLTEDDLRGYFAEARSLMQEATTVTFRKGANRTVLARTHGLPKPDTSI